MVNWTSVKLSDLMRQKTLRMDAKYWIQKALLKKRKKELTYNTALDIVFMNRCHDCGCTPKNDEWSNRAKNLCIDCKDD